MPPVSCTGLTGWRRRSSISNVKVLRRLWPLLLLVGAVLVFYFSILSGRRYMWEDVMYMYYPYDYFLFGALRSFSIPLWNPHVYSGMPFLGDIQSQVFYPLNWLLAQISSSNQNHVYWLVELKAVLHCLLAGVATYLLGRELGRSKLAALLSGFSFMFSGFMVLHMIHLTMVSTFAWFPLLLLFFNRVFVRGRSTEFVFGAIVLGLSSLAGHPQMTLHMLASLVLLFGLFAGFGWRQQGRRILTRHLPALVGMILLGLALAAVAYLPAFLHSRYTERELMTFAESAEISLRPSFLLNLLAPKFFGGATADPYAGVQFWAGAMRHEYWETGCYIGVLPLVFAAFAAAFDRSRARIALLVLGGVALLAALGRYTPFYRLLYELPGFDRFRIPARFISIVDLALALLAGIGLDGFREGSGRGRLVGFSRVLTGVAILVVLSWLASAAGLFRGASGAFRRPEVYSWSTGQLGGAALLLALASAVFWLRVGRRPKRGKPAADRLLRVLPAAVVAITFVDLYAFGASFNPGPQGPGEYYRRDRQVTFLQQERREEPFRINAREGGAMVLKRNEGMVQGLELLEGYTPLKLANYVSLQIPRQRQADLLNAKYMLVLDSVRRQLRLGRNATYLPRAKMFYQYVVEPDSGRVLAMLRDPDFDYRNVLIVDRSPPFGDQAPTGPEPPGEAEILEQSGTCLRIRVRTGRPGLLFVSEVYYPRWRAFVDGEDTEILVADHCLRAVPVDAGEHEVGFRYEDSSLAVGGFVSGLAILLCVGLVFVDRARHRRSSGSGSS